MQQFQITKASVFKYNRNSVLLIILGEIPVESIPLPPLPKRWMAGFGTGTQYNITSKRLINLRVSCSPAKQPQIVVFLEMCVCAKSLQLCPTLCDPMDYSPPGSSVHGILQARILEWVAMF